MCLGNKSLGTLGFSEILCAQRNAQSPAAFISNSFNKNVLSTYHVPGLVLSRSENKVGEALAPRSFCPSVVEEMPNENIWSCKTHDDCQKTGRAWRNGGEKEGPLWGSDIGTEVGTEVSMQKQDKL